MPSDAQFEFFVVRREGSAESLTSWGASEPDKVPFTPTESVPAGPRGAVFSTITLPASAELVPDAKAVELVTLPFRNREGDYYLQVGVLPAELESVVRPFLDLFLFGIPLASLAALAAAWVISGRAVEPLLRLSRAARDVSPSRLGERILLETHEREVADLQDELNQALERLEAGYRSQEEFIANVSHELKTPIAVLRSQSQLLAEGSHSPEAHREFVASVEEETKRLGRMVESFLALARYGWARSLTETAEVQVVDVVVDAVRHASPLADKHGVRLSARFADPEDDAPTVSGDPRAPGDDAREPPPQRGALLPARRHRARRGLEHRRGGRVARARRGTGRARRHARARVRALRRLGGPARWTRRRDRPDDGEERRRAAPRPHLCP